MAEDQRHNNKEAEKEPQPETKPLDRLPDKEHGVEELLSYLTSAKEAPDKQRLFQLLSIFFSFGPSQQQGFAEKIADKMTSDHVTLMIKGEQDERKSSRKWSFAYFLTGIIVVGITVGLFTWINRMDILTPILAALIALFGGYGYGSRRKRS